MSYPGYHQPDFLESIQRGLQVRSMVEEIKARREARSLQGELHRQALEDRQRKAQEDQFNMTMKLQELGAIPAMPGDTGQNDATLSAANDIPPEGRRPLMQTPVGSYRMPSQLDRTARLRSRAQEQGMAEGIEAGAKAQGVEEEGRRSGRLIEATIPAMGDQPAVRLFIPREKAAEHRKTVRELQAGKFSKSEFKTDPQTGKTYFFGIDADTGEPVERELGTTMAPKPAGADREALPTNADIEALMNKWRQNFYNSRGITQEVLDAARGRNRPDPETGAVTSNPEAARVREAEKELQEAAEKEVKARIRNNSKGTQAPASTQKRTGFDPSASRGVPIRPNHGLQVGQTKTVRGKQMRITKVYPDGSFDAQ